MSFICIITFIVSLLIEKNIVCIYHHKQFIMNILMGVFASGLLVLSASIVAFFFEKGKLYVNILVVS